MQKKGQKWKDRDQSMGGQRLEVGQHIDALEQETTIYGEGAIPHDNGPA